MITRNMLIDWLESEPKLERVLAIDASQEYAWTIDILSATAWPIRRKCIELKTAIWEGQVQVIDDDPHGWLRTKAEENISLAYREHRDRLWEYFRSLVDTEDVFIPSRRASLIREISTQTGFSDKTVRKYMRRLLQAGFVKNALLPHYDNSGGRGKPRQSKDGSRLGRLSLHEAKNGRQKTGVPITDEIKAKFRLGIKQFYENRRGGTLRQAYERTLQKYFAAGVDQLKNGQLAPKLPPIEELPTYRQFSYWYKNERSPKTAVISRRGRKNYDANHRPILGSVTDLAPYPGSVFAIDATHGDTALVGTDNPNEIVDSPTIYTAIDMNSGLVVGFAATYEKPSFTSAMLCLHNTFKDKVTFCAEYGFSISEEDWPCHYIPEVLLADRGELVGSNADHLASNLGFRISNTASYRGDMKGRVEKMFDLFNQNVIRKLPGAVPKERIRGDKNYRLGARLNLDELTAILIGFILEYNKHHWMRDYPVTQGMLRDNIDLTPLSIWNWGIQNLGGRPRTESPEILDMCLLPADEASVTRAGIRFKGLEYTCKLANQGNWFTRADLEGTWKVKVAYHPHHVNVIYLRPDKQNGIVRFEPCTLLDKHMKGFGNRSFKEVAMIHEELAERERAHEWEKLQSRARVDAHIDAVSKKAERRYHTLRDGRSNHSRLQGREKNRERELRRRRQEDRWGTTNDKYIQEPDNLTEQEIFDEGYVPDANPTSKLDEALAKKRGNSANGE